MSFEDIVTMIVSAAPRLRTGEMNRMIEAIRDALAGDGSVARIQQLCNTFIARNHMTPAESVMLMGAVDTALAW